MEGPQIAAFHEEMTMTQKSAPQRQRLVRVGDAHRLTQGAFVGQPEAVNPLGREIQG